MHRKLHGTLQETLDCVTQFAAWMVHLGKELLRFVLCLNKKYCLWWEGSLTSCERDFPVVCVCTCVYQSLVLLKHRHNLILYII